jgi:phosphatidate cytidylyltransferase
MLRQRAITALLMGLPVLGILLFAPPVWTIVVLAIVMLIGAWEWAGFLRGARVGMRITYVVLIGLLIAFALFSPQAFDTKMMLLLAVIWWVIAAVRIVVLPETELRAFVYAGGVLVLLPMWVALITLTLHHPQGGQLILSLLLIVASTDIGAYFVGRALGRHKLAPRVSPGKTWEGVVGGLLSSIVIAALAAYWFGFKFLEFIA